MHFARNLAEGHGFAYNPGTPVSGSTAPLWTLALGGLFAVRGANPAWAKALGIVTAMATALAAMALAWRWTESRRLALLAGALTAMSGPLVWGALSGMEVSLAALLATSALLGHASGHDAVAAALLALAALARPEVVLLALLVWLARPLTWRRTALFALAMAACLGPWVAFNVATTGAPLPATASAKIEGGLVGFLAGAREGLLEALVARPLRFEGEWIGWLFSVNALLPPLMVAGLVALWRRGGRAHGGARRRPPDPSHRDGAARSVPRARVPGRALLDSPPAARHRGGRRGTRVALAADPGPCGDCRRAGPGRPGRRRSGGAPVRVGRPEHRRDAGRARALGRRQHGTGRAPGAERHRRDRLRVAAPRRRRHGTRHPGHHPVPPGWRGGRAALSRANVPRLPRSSSRRGSRGSPR